MEGDCMNIHDNLLSTMDHMDKMDQMDKEKKQHPIKNNFHFLSKTSMEQLYQELYKAPYYEVGFESNGEFRRRIVKKNIELVDWVLRLRDKHSLYILSHGHPYFKDARELNPNTFLTNKIFLDFDGTDLQGVWCEVESFIHGFIRKYGGLPFVQFSGKKGYHVYLLLPKHEGSNQFSLNTIHGLLKHLQTEFDLKFLDESVISNPLRLARAPFSFHQETGSLVYPMIMNPKPSPGLIPLLKVIQEKTLEDEIFKQNNLLVKQKKAEAMAKSGGDEIKNWNVVDKIMQSFHETGRHVHGTKHVVCCPFHDDNHPSAFYDDKLFHCSTCGLTVGSYRLLVECMGKSKGEALDVIKSFQ